MLMTWIGWCQRYPAPLLWLTFLSIPASAWHDGAWHSPRWDMVLLVAVASAPLVFRMKWPILVVIVTMLIELACINYVPEMPAVLPLACCVALCSMATKCDQWRAWILGCLVAAAVGHTLAHRDLGPTSVAQTIIMIDSILVSVGLGRMIRQRMAVFNEAHERAAYFERTREQEARRQVAEERVRIARDLHDVVAHHITLVNAQAGVARHLFSDKPDKALAALDNIRDTSRAALDQLRATVGFLREPEDGADPIVPSPGMANIDDLFEAFNRAGTSASVSLTGEVRQLDAIVELTAYRIMQEAMTNVHKHAPQSQANVTIDFGKKTLRISIFNEAAPAPAGGAGHGLIGMRERASAVGGTLKAGFSARGGHGGFEVIAELPIHDKAAR
jgi:signal transduction histidine kinase